MGKHNNIVIAVFLSAVGAISAQYTLIGSPTHVVVTDVVTLTLTCTTQQQYVKWFKDSSLFTIITGVNPDGSCKFADVDQQYTYSCDNTSGTYNLTQTDVTITEEIGNTTWSCGPIVGIGVVNFFYTVAVPVTMVTITPTGTNNVASIVQGDKQTFTCATDSTRPAAWIQWYIGTQNVTSSATPQPPQQDGDKFITSSTLEYTGNDADHNKVIHCEAVNIEGRQTVRSGNISISIKVPVTTVTITPTGTNNVISIVLGNKQTFTCTTDSTRPAAWIQWYIGTQNVTSSATPQPPQQNGDKFIASSTLEYTGNDANHNKVIHCEAININDRQTVRSGNISISIKVPVSSVDILPAGNNNILNIVEGNVLNLTCITSPSRPSAVIHWFIGNTDVTHKATQNSVDTDREMSVTYSQLLYTGNDEDHMKNITCKADNSVGSPRSIYKIMYIQLPVTTVTITPTGTNNVISIVQGDKQTFTCTTDSTRPAAWIQWYIGTQNVTSSATPQKPQQDGDKFISSSTLEYTGNDADHNNAIHCEAVNIDGRQTVRSGNISISIKVPVSSVDISPSGYNNTLYIVEGNVLNLTCITSPSRPSAVIHWFIGDGDVTSTATQNIVNTDRDMSITYSQLLYTGNDVDHMKNLTCKGDNSVGSPRSMHKIMYIQFGPKNITLSPDVSEYRVQENKDSVTIHCTSTCRPTCTHYWIGPGNYRLPDGNLVLEHIYRNHTGKYICHANNEFGDMSSNNVTITVDYKPSVTNLMFANNNTVGERQSATFICEIDSHPLSDVIWKKTTDTLQTDANVVQSNYTIHMTTCLNTGIYQCSASNKIDGEMFSDAKEIELFVLCSVRIDSRQHPNLDTKIGVEKDDGLNITLSLIGYPQPTIIWTFSSNDTNASVPIASNESYGIFTHTTEVFKKKMDRSDFGLYSLHAINRIGKELIQTFTVVPQREPDPPTNISVKCGIASATVWWRSEFDGGDTQQFQLIWWKVNVNKSMVSDSIDDPGESYYGFGLASILDDETLYFFTVQSQNVHGSVTSLETVNCTTDKQPLDDEGDNSAVIGGVAGSVSAVLLVLLLLGILYIRRRNKKRGDDREPIKRHPTGSDDDVADGLKDNILYESAGPDFAKQKKATAVEYAEVQKKGNAFHPVAEGDIQETPLYTEVKKKPKHRQKGDAYQNIPRPTKTKGRENNKPPQNGDDKLYENFEEKNKHGATSNRSQNNRNKHGLHYADLVFNPTPNGAKFIIHGLEDRTIYAVVDTTQKIDPLPDSCSDDEDNADANAKETAHDKDNHK